MEKNRAGDGRESFLLLLVFGTVFVSVRLQTETARIMGRGIRDLAEFSQDTDALLVDALSIELVRVRLYAARR